MNLTAVLVPIVVLTLAACSSSEEGSPAVGTAGTGAGGESTSSDAGGDPLGPSHLDWSPCNEPDLAGAECTMLEVPMDYEDPEGEKIEIALSRVAASDPSRRIGALLINPGGPGSGRLAVL